MISKIGLRLFLLGLAGICLPISTGHAQCSAEDITSYMQGGASAAQLSELCGNSGGGAAGQRYVVVNGALLHPLEISQLEYMACTSIPDGEYWLDPGTGIWGYAGNGTPQGRLGDQC